MEVSVDSLESAEVTARAGAARLELSDGGHTPTQGMVMAVLKDLRVALGVLKPDGVTLDEGACRRLISAAAPMPVTLNGAFDYALKRGGNPVALLFAALAVGFKRVVTSGGAASAEHGVELIRRLVLFTSNHLVVMPRGGITDVNLKHVLCRTRASAFQACASDLLLAGQGEVHAADGDPDPDAPADAPADAPRVVCEGVVKRMADIAKAHRPFGRKSWG